MKYDLLLCECGNEFYKETIRHYTYVEYPGASPSTEEYGTCPNCGSEKFDYKFEAPASKYRFTRPDGITIECEAICLAIAADVFSQDLGSPVNIHEIKEVQS